MFKKNKAILKLMAATCLKKVGTAPCLAQCSILSSFNNTVNVWEQRRPVAGVLGEKCCPILAWYRILIAQQSRVFVVFFVFKVHQYIFSWWKVWTANRPVKHLYFSITKSCCFHRWSMRFSIALMKYARPSLKKDFSMGAFYIYIYSAL